MTGNRGSVVVEMAAVVPIVILLVLALVEIAVVARVQLEVVNAAREGAREAAASPDPARAVRAAKGALPDPDRATVTVTRPHVVGERATVVVNMRHRIATPLFGGFAIDLVGRATMRVES